MTGSSLLTLLLSVRLQALHRADSTGCCPFEIDRVLRRLIPTLRRLQVPTLAVWGELDNNILAEKNKAAWEAALKAGGHRDYTLRILAKANHAQWEAKIGSNAEMKSLDRFVPAYFTTIQHWLGSRIRRFDDTR